jgi:predicted hydrocarbon binding protein
LPYTESASSGELGKLVRDNDKGWIMAYGKRIITFRIHTFQAMMDKLTSIAGATVSKTLFYQMGEEIGQKAMEYSKPEIQSPSDLVRVADEALTLHGWGRCLSLEVNDRGDKTVYVCLLNGNPSSHERTADEPTCHMMRGVVAGWLEAYLGKKAESSTETVCASMGNEDCAFEIVFESGKAA